MNVHSTSRPVMNGAAEDYWISIVLDLNAGDSVSVNIVLF